MNDALMHRGPDGGGTKDFDFGSIGMRRLSIVDIEFGHQPMGYSGGAEWIVFNGEIYDFGELRQTLELQGRIFRTRSDTEVLLQHVATNGKDSLRDINGMFAFAIVNEEERSVLLARDRQGIKPLYYYFDNSTGGLAFSSELGSLVACPFVPRRLDHKSLRMLLVDRYVADPWTMFDQVYQLPPGCWLLWKDGAIEIRRYVEDECSAEQLGERESIAALDVALGQSVRSQLVADVPVGVLLSGGIDSSIVAAYAAESSERKIHTFSVGFSDSRFDESSIAHEVANHLNTEHHEIRVSDRAFDRSQLTKIVRHVGQPVADTSCIPMLQLAEFASRHVKVVLSGDGGDEFFGGYEHINWAAKVMQTSRLPLPLFRKLIVSLVSRNSRAIARLPGMSAQSCRRIVKGLEASLLPTKSQLRGIMALWQFDDSERILRDAVDLRPNHELIADSVRARSDAEFVMQLLAHTYMPGAILTKVDRMSMAASLEVRVPLLDNRVTAAASSMPIGCKIKGRTGKQALRMVGVNRLPASVFSHPKQGFAIPLSRWVNRDFWSYLDAAYAPGQDIRDLFNDGAIARTIAEGKSAGRGDPSVSPMAAVTRCWMLAMLACWKKEYSIAL